jgi:hypothetical protein
MLRLVYKTRTHPSFINGLEALEKPGSIIEKTDVETFKKARGGLLKQVMVDTTVYVSLPFNVKELLNRKFDPQVLIVDKTSFFRAPELFYILSRICTIDRTVFAGDDTQLGQQASILAGQQECSGQSRRLNSYCGKGMSVHS